MIKFYIFFIIFISSGLAFAYDEDSMEYEDMSFETNPYNFTSKCKKAGLMCADCENLVNCIETGPGDFLPIPIETCNKDKNETCLINECSTKPNRLCTESGSPQFKCHSTGVFPDALDCQLYHICVAPEDDINPKDKKFKYIGAKCDGLYMYNPVTTYCDKLMVNNACPTVPSVPECKQIGQSGPIPGTSIFYICIGNPLIAELYMCPHGTKFVNGRCT